MTSAPSARRRLSLLPSLPSPTPVFGRAFTLPPRLPPPPPLGAAFPPPPPDGFCGAAPGQWVSPTEIALPALPPLLMSPIDTTPPLPDAVATPPLPELAVSVCNKRCSNAGSDSDVQLW